MNLKDFIINFRSSALELDLKCPLGCAKCCLSEDKQCTKDEVKSIRNFLSDNNVSTHLLSDTSLKHKLNGACAYYNLGCSINPVKPAVCRNSYTNCDKGKGVVVSQGHNFHSLELININSYLAESGKLLDELNTDDFNIISDRIIDMTELLSSYLKNHELPQLNGEELLTLYKSLVSNRINSMSTFDKLRVKVDSVSISYIGVPCFLWDWSNEIKSDFSFLNKRFIKPVDYDLTIEKLKDDIQIASSNKLRADLGSLAQSFNKAYLNYLFRVSLTDEKLLLILNS